MAKASQKECGRSAESSDGRIVSLRSSFSSLEIVGRSLFSLRQVREAATREARSSRPVMSSRSSPTRAVSFDGAVPSASVVTFVVFATSTEEGVMASLGDSSSREASSRCAEMASASTGTGLLAFVASVVVLVSAWEGARPGDVVRTVGGIKSVVSIINRVGRVIVREKKGKRRTREAERRFLCPLRLRQRRPSANSGSLQHRILGKRH